MKQKCTQIHPSLAPVVSKKLDELCETTGFKQSVIITMAINELYKALCPDGKVTSDSTPATTD